MIRGVVVVFGLVAIGLIVLGGAVIAQRLTEHLRRRAQERKR